MGKNYYGLFFTRGSDVVRLPFNPSTLPVDGEGDNGTYNVLGIGQIIIPRIPNLRKITISSFFPGQPYAWVLNTGSFEPPEFFVNFFRSAMEDGDVLLYTPVRYYEDGTPYMTSDTGMDVIVTDFNVEERGGETGDFYYELTLSEYRDYSPQTVEIGDVGGSRQASSQPTRRTGSGEIVVGSTCIANGNWYYTSYGDEPHGNGNGRRVVVSRIVDSTRARPIHVTTESGGALGWMRKSDLEVV